MGPWRSKQDADGSGPIPLQQLSDDTKRHLLNMRNGRAEEDGSFEYLMAAAVRRIKETVDQDRPKRILFGMTAGDIVRWLLSAGAVVGMFLWSFYGTTQAKPTKEEARNIAIEAAAPARAGVADLAGRMEKLETRTTSINDTMIKITVIQEQQKELLTDINRALRRR